MNLGTLKENDFLPVILMPYKILKIYEDNFKLKIYADDANLILNYTTSLYIGLSKYQKTIKRYLARNKYIHLGKHLVNRIQSSSLHPRIS